MATDPAKIARELKWLKKNPAFLERPASLPEFLGDDYLGIERGVRTRIREVLTDIMGDDVSGERMTKFPLALITGGIGIGKTTVASIVLPYLCHWVLCLEDPQDYFGLLPGSRIAFMQMSTSEDQAKQVLFGDIDARIRYSPWFRDNFPKDPTFKNQIRFPKDIWILPGDSQDTTFEGYNILGGIIDEADSHKVTKDKDYAETGFRTIHARITSRFQERGFLLIIGQKKKQSGFVARKHEEFESDPTAYAVSLPIWESLGWDRFTKPDGTRDSFFYDTRRKMIVPAGAAKLSENDSIIEVPTVYKKDFQHNPEEALKDHAGIPPAVGDPFISLVHKIHEARDRWVRRTDGLTSPVTPDGRFEPWFHAQETIKRVAHIDIAYSGDGDSLGFAMGHVREVVEIDGEYKPYIVFDVIMRMKASPGQEIFLGDARRMIYSLRDDFKFKLKRVTMDGFQCFTGDTRIPLLDGRTLTMRELADQHPEGGVGVYSWNGAKIVPGKVTRAWRTGTRPVITIVLDNGERVRCTPDHRWMLRDGTYRRADELKTDDSLMPLYRRITPPDWKGLKGYEQVWQPRDGARGGRKWQFTHRMVWGSDVPAGHVIHHQDVQKLNNDPSNLRLMTLEDHLEWHRVHGESAFGEIWNRPGHREKMSRIISESNRERTGSLARRFRHDVTVEDLAAVRHMTRRAITQTFGWSQDMIYSRVREAGFDGWVDFKKSYAPSNHRVVAVIDSGETEDVFDLTVEDHHNFALDAGVFVHNSTDTRQQLQRRRFEVGNVSVDKDVLPYHDLREALYEDRIEFPPYMTIVRTRDGRATEVEIAVKELTELSEGEKKVDHPNGGSKDVADAMAGVVFTLMGDRQYRKRVVSLTTVRDQRVATGTGGSGWVPPGMADFVRGGGVQAPIPPHNPTWGDHGR